MTNSLTRICDLKGHQGKDVTLAGWLYNSRAGGKETLCRQSWLDEDFLRAEALRPPDVVDTILTPRRRAPFPDRLVLLTR